MPPASPPSDEPTAVTDGISLTDEDVELLHAIVSTAEQAPDVETKPFAAIFAAYDEVLAEHGFSSDHDQIYLRFLLRMGKNRRSGQNLYELFEVALLEHGIQLMHGEENYESQEAYTGLAEAGTPGVTRGRSRRASFSSYVDGEEITRISQFRTESRASEVGARPRRPSTRATTRPTEKVETRITRSRTPRASPTHGRLTAREFASNYNTPQKRQASSLVQNDELAYRHITPGPRTKKIRLESAVPSLPADDTLDLEGHGTQDTTLSSFRSLGSPIRMYRDVLFRPSETQLLRDAGTYEHFRVRDVARESIRRWRTLAISACHDHNAMYERAIAHDRIILLRQAFDQWRDHFLARKQAAEAKRKAAETERYYNQLERRVESARDLHLLTLAFTHWVQCTSDNVERTSVARREILRLRYFTAWLKLTAVNALKVRRQRLRKFFLKWKHAQRFESMVNSRAVTFYYDNLVEKVYWIWVWKYYERRAAEWRNARLKRQYFIFWLATHRTDEEMREFAIKSHQLNLQRRYFNRWLRKTRTTQTQKRQAEQLYQKNLIRRCLSMWQKQLRLLLSSRKIEGMVNWRIASTAFSTLVLRFRCEKQAEQINERRIVWNTWTLWNDRLRWQTLQHQIDDRLLVQALYKWVLAERLSLLQRLSDERLKRRTLARLLNHRISLETQKARVLQLIVERRNKTLMSSVVNRWHEKLQLHHQDNRLAFEFQAPKLAQDTIKAWTHKTQHNQKMSKWAKDASYYFLCTSSLKRWKTAVLESKSQKRKAAYATIRRLVKTNLARNILAKWYLRQLHISALQDLATTHTQQQSLLFATSLFDHWHSRLSTSLTASTTALSLYSENLARANLQLWYSRFQETREADTKALDYSTSHVQKIAYEAIRSLQLKVFEYRAHAQTATELRAWNKRRHYRAFLRVWHEKSLRRRGVDISIAVPNSEFARSYRSRRTAGLRSTTSTTVAGVAEGDEKLEDEDNEDKDFELGDWIPALEAQSSMTPLPGYLSTPSKRAARARAMVRGTSAVGGGMSVPATPVGLRRGTPLTSRTALFRRGIATEGRVIRVGIGDLGRSVRGLRFESAGFEDIVEGGSNSLLG